VEKPDNLADEHEPEPAEYAAFKEMRLKRTSPKPSGQNAYEKVKSLLVERLSTYLEQKQGALSKEQIRPFLLKHFNALLVEERIVLTGSERRLLFEDVLGELSGSGPQVNGSGSS
jgi:hypothetical protein